MDCVKNLIGGSYRFFPSVFKDSRGYFSEVYSREETKTKFVQDNVSYSDMNVLRGIHFQTRNPQGKYIRVLQGSVLDCIIDLRPSSPTFARLESFFLNPNVGLYVPPGCAHGFLTLEPTIFFYKCTELWDKDTDGGINPFDPMIQYPWHHLKDGVNITSKDMNLPKLGEYILTGNNKPEMRDTECSEVK